MTSNIKNIFRLKPVSADKEESPLQVVDTDNNAESTEETRKRTYHEPVIETVPEIMEIILLYQFVWTQFIPNFKTRKKNWRTNKTN
jgi:hypothetical protein